MFKPLVQAISMMGYPATGHLMETSASETAVILGMLRM
jgi:hypothetical protein